MGAYLSAPVTDKESSDGTSNRLSYGASSMQGWRRTQEDAHNCITDFEEDSSFFAVYDGHGGSEVAKYCAEHLPDFILSHAEYKKGNIVKALEDAFLDFDATLIKPEVILELKQIAGLSEASESDDNTEKLHIEARMPLEELLAQYHGVPIRGKLAPHLMREFHNENPKSPMLRAKTDAKMKISSSVPDDGTVENTEDDACNNADAAVASTEEEGGPCDSVRSSTENRIVNGKEDEEEESDKQNTCDSTTDDLNLPIQKNSKLNQESLVSDTSEAEVVDSKKTKLKDNGVISSSDNKITSVCDSEIPESSMCDTSDTAANTSHANSSCSYVDEEDSNGADSSSRKRVAPKIYNDSSESSEDDDEDYGVSESGEGSDDDEDNDGEDGSGDKADEEEDEDDDDDDDDEEDDYEGAEAEICEKEEPGSESGCTAVLAVLIGDMLYVANAGDSRCVVCREGQALDMSADHKPEDKLEKTRIENAGGEVTMDGRVNGGLNLSRAIGDHAYKQNAELGPREQMITALPDVKTLKLDPSQDKFVVLACDGIWNHMSSQEVVEFVQERIEADNVKLSSICEELFDNCLAPSTDGDGTGCDNMTCIIVKFHDLKVSSSGKRSYPDSDDAELSGSNKKRKECAEAKAT